MKRVWVAMRTARLRFLTRSRMESRVGLRPNTFLDRYNGLNPYNTMGCHELEPGRWASWFTALPVRKTGHEDPEPQPPLKHGRRK